jgi:CRP/FNR family transcriptional regulator, cyclic AMP receptor protein
MRKTLYILGQLDDSDVDWLTQNGTRRPLAPGEVIVNEGRSLDTLFITLAGHFLVTLHENREIAKLGAGEIVGEISFVDDAPPSATVTAVAPALVLAVSKAVLQDQLDRNHEFAARFYRALAIFLADRLRATDSQLTAYTNAGDLAAEGPLLDELDSVLLDTISEAGRRFTRLLQTLAAA